MDDEEEAARAIDDMVEAIAQQFTATPIEERKAVMEAIGQGLLGWRGCAQPRILPSHFARLCGELLSDQL